MRINLAVAAFCSALMPLAAYAFPGRANGEPAIFTGIGRIVDGDTLDVGTTRVRLEGIDAPEIAQTCQTASGEAWNCGVAAAAMLRKLAEHRELMCERKGTDRYRRVLATCFADGVDIDAAMVRAGLAWAFVRYSTVYVAVEAEARKDTRSGSGRGRRRRPGIFAVTNGKSLKRARRKVAQSKATSPRAVAFITCRGTLGMIGSRWSRAGANAGSAPNSKPSRPAGVLRR
jgi:endonuclease YncB( thermonuclease family)